jgi:hypothetical protein
MFVPFRAETFELPNSTLPRDRAANATKILRFIRHNFATDLAGTRGRQQVTVAPDHAKQLYRPTG